MKILAIDPSSTKTGFALFDEDENLIDAGILKPNKTTDCAAYRIEAMCKDFRALLDQYEPAFIVIEWTSGKVGRKRHKGGGAGLAIYGIAIGALWRVAEQWCSDNIGDVVRILENEWTAGKSKKERFEIISTLYPKIDLSKDTGGDIADAIGLGMWFIHRRRQNIAAKASK